MFEYRFYLGMSSADPAGVLFYPALFRHAHDAYEAFMRENEMALEAILAEGRHALPIVHAEADYRRPLRHGAAVSVAVTIGRLGKTSFTVDFDFRDDSGECCATARSVHVVVDRTTGAHTPIPETWRRLLETHLQPQS